MFGETTTKFIVIFMLIGTLSAQTDFVTTTKTNPNADVDCGNNWWCLDDKVCCPLAADADDDFGCCPHVGGECCPDLEHCCDVGFTCVGTDPATMCE